MKNADIINAAARHYYAHRELSLVEAAADKKRYLRWIVIAQKELNKILGV